MKRLILLSAIAAATLFAGCVIDERSERLEPTRPGYFLFQQSHNAFLAEMNDLWPVFAFSQYYAAESDEERELIHDRYFYTQRITHTGSKWRIISETYQLVIETHGRSLYDENSQWSYYYTDHDYDTNGLPTITQSGPEFGRYELHLPQYPKRESGIWGDLTLSASWLNHPSEDRAILQLRVSGSGVCKSGDLEIDFDIQDPLVYNTSRYTFDRGQFILTTTNNDLTDITQAEIDFDNIHINYNGYSKIWNLKYEDRFRYE